METATSKEGILIKALTKMLKPFVRLLIKQNIPYPSLIHMLKRTYIEVAEESYSLDNKRLTDSRISLLTGVHRGEVKTLRNEIQENPSQKELKASLSAQIMSVWTGHQAYLTADNQPAELYRYSQDGSPSFEELVLSVSKDKHPRSILDEWLHQELVVLTNADDIERVALTKTGYVPEKDFEEKLFFAGKNIGDHLSIVDYNLAGNEKPMFDRAVYYNRLSLESVQRIEQLANEKMMAALTEINQFASQLQADDKTDNDNQSAMHVGAYFHRNQQKED